MVGETVSHYRIVAEIDAGCMGVAYKAEDLRLGRLVALKFLPPTSCANLMQSDASFRKRARRRRSITYQIGCLLMGVFGGTSALGVDSFNFASRLRTPILMLNGDQDHICPVRTSQRALFQALGTLGAAKKLDQAG